MKVIETDGIVLKTMDFKEKDCILTFLTTKAGKKAGILHGGKTSHHREHQFWTFREIHLKVPHFPHYVPKQLNICVLHAPAHAIRHKSFHHH
jgi:hypothetical protein